MICSTTKILVIAFIIISIILLLQVSKDYFTTTVGTFHSLEQSHGTQTEAHVGRKYLLHQGTWKIYSSNVPKTYVFRVTAEGLPNKLFLRSPGKVVNLPALLGGLPAFDNYTAIFNSGAVHIEVVSLATAESEIKSGKAGCMAMENANNEYCENEFTSL